MLRSLSTNRILWLILALLALIAALIGVLYPRLYHPRALETVVLPRHIRLGSVGFSLLSPLMFYPLWISALVPLMQTGRKLEHLYSVYILDLCFIMPAFVIVAVQTARERGLGMLLTPATYVLGVTLLFPVGIGELFKPRYGLSIDTGGLGLYLGLSAMFLVLALVYLPHLRVGEER